MGLEDTLLIHRYSNGEKKRIEKEEEKRLTAMTCIKYNNLFLNKNSLSFFVCTVCIMFHHVEFNNWIATVLNNQTRFGTSFC